LITGCSSGIGLATAVHFARRGHQVYAGVRNPDHAVELREAIQAHCLSATPVTLDVDDDDSAAWCVRTVLEQGHPLDVLVDNAGIGGGGPIEETPLPVVRQIFETNFFGALRMIRAVLPAMRERRRGTIVNVSSAAGRVAIAAHGPYAASKW